MKTNISQDSHVS